MFHNVVFPDVECRMTQSDDTLINAVPGIPRRLFVTSGQIKYFLSLCVCQNPTYYLLNFIYLIRDPTSAAKGQRSDPQVLIVYDTYILVPKVKNKVPSWNKGISYCFD